MKEPSVLGVALKLLNVVEVSRLQHSPIEGVVDNDRLVQGPVQQVAAFEVVLVVDVDAVVAVEPVRYAILGVNFIQDEVRSLLILVAEDHDFVKLGHLKEEVFQPQPLEGVHFGGVASD